MSANIVIRQSDSNVTPGSREDLVLNTSVTLLNQNNSGVSTWLWQIIDKPAGSSASLSSSSTATTTFTPDVEGTYLVRLSVNSGAATNQVGAAIKTANLVYRIPAALEDNEFDPTRGWAAALNNALTLLDDGYGALKSAGGVSLSAANTWTAKQTFSSHIAVDGYTVNLSGGATSNQVLRYNGTNFIASTDVLSVTNSDGSLTISPTTGAVIAGINLAHSNTFTATQSFTNHINVDGYDFKPGFTAPTDGQALAWSNSNSAYIPTTISGGGGSLQSAYVAGSTITLVNPGEGYAPVVISADSLGSNNEIFAINDHASNSLLLVTDTTAGTVSPFTPSITGTVFIRRLILLGGDELVLGGTNTGDVLRYNAGTSKWSPAPFTLWNITAIHVGGDTYNAIPWDLVRVDGTDDGYGNVGVVLPDATTSTGQSIKVKDIIGGNTSGNVKITTSGGQTIDGSGFIFLNSIGAGNNFVAVTFTSDGANWVITDYYNGTP